MKGIPNVLKKILPNKVTKRPSNKAYNLAFYFKSKLKNQQKFKNILRHFLIKSRDLL